MEHLKKTFQVRVKLDRRNLVTFGVLVTCKCGRQRWINDKEAEPMDVWSCISCHRPLVLVDVDGRFYLIGHPATQRGVDDRV